MTDKYRLAPPTTLHGTCPLYYSINIQPWTFSWLRRLPTWRERTVKTFIVL